MQSLYRGAADLKVLFVETELTGHHLTYLNCLIEASSSDNDVWVAIPKENDDIRIDKSHIRINPFLKNGIKGYRKWLGELKRIVSELKPDVVHFLYGDSLYRFFGYGIGSIRKESEVIITCHQIRRSIIRDFSLKRIAKVSSMLVVHTETLKKNLKRMGIEDVQKIEYPQFCELCMISAQEAKRCLGIDSGDKKVLLAIGGTRYDKGLDILLEALNKVKNNFYLVIAGKEEYFKRDFIESKLAAYKDCVSLFMGVLSDEQFSFCMNCADIIVLPYRKSFDGASGPLGEGVAHGKMIIGPNHKSLGSLIEQNHLGLTFATEDVEDLASKLDEALSIEWHPDEAYEAYQGILSPKRFQAEYKQLYRRVLE